MEHHNPFISADNQFGEWDLPFETAAGAVEVQGLMVDSVNVTAASLPTPVGVMPVLVLDFHSSAGRSAPRIIFVAGIETMNNFAQLINRCVAAATSAAEQEANVAGE